MSDRVSQALTNLAYEVKQLSTDYLGLVTSLSILNPDLVSDSAVLAAKQRLNRLKMIIHGLQQQAKQD